MQNTSFFSPLLLHYKYCKPLILYGAAAPYLVNLKYHNPHFEMTRNSAKKNVALRYYLWYTGTLCRMVRVVFIHPDLGIGGAERLVVDAAVALKSKGCSVQIWTAHYDPSHCFSETLDPDLPVVHRHTHVAAAVWTRREWMNPILLNRCVWVTGYPPVCLATCMHSVPTWGWSTWLSICSSSAA